MRMGSTRDRLAWLLAYLHKVASHIIEEKKIEAILNIQAPLNVKEVRAFIGAASDFLTRHVRALPDHISSHRSLS